LPLERRKIKIIKKKKNEKTKYFRKNLE